jgi:hypothetical protein
LFSSPAAAQNKNGHGFAYRNNVCVFDAVTAEFLPESIPRGANSVLVDDLHCLQDMERRKLLRNDPRPLRSAFLPAWRDLSRLADALQFAGFVHYRRAESFLTGFTKKAGIRDITASPGL